MGEIHSCPAMKGKSPCQSELNLFEPVLRQVTESGHPLRIMADIFPWNEIENDYSTLYSDKGAPSKPVRLMTGLLILKQIFNGSDEGIVSEWARDHYFQYLCGGNMFIKKIPCDPSDMAHFRKRIGPERLQHLQDLIVMLKHKSGTDKIKISNGSKPGHNNFSYNVETGFYRIFKKSFLKMAGKFSSAFSVYR